MAIDTISIDKAGEIDCEWMNAGQPDNGLRIYGLRRSTYTVTYLAVPGNDQAPCYIYGKSGYYHVAGPTLAEWQAQQASVQIALDNARRYEAQSASSAANGSEVNARCFAEKAAFYTAQAAEFAGGR
jgi:hypothetical protein